MNEDEKFVFPFWLPDISHVKGFFSPFLFHTEF